MTCVFLLIVDVLRSFTYTGYGKISTSPILNLNTFADNLKQTSLSKETRAFLFHVIQIDVQLMQVCMENQKTKSIICKP